MRKNTRMKRAENMQLNAKFLLDKLLDDAGIPETVDADDKNGSNYIMDPIM